MLTLLKKLRLPISISKLFEPAQCIPCLGIDIDINKGTLSIPTEKLDEIQNICNKWLNVSKATKNQLQSLVGSLIYVHKCVRPARLFINRILAVLRAAPDKGKVILGHGFKRDVSWFVSFLAVFNGSVYFYKRLTPANNNIHLDACLSGIGAVWQGRVYSVPVALVVSRSQSLTIVHLEMLNILVALRIWAPFWQGMQICIHCDNEAVVSSLNSGRGRDPYLLAVSRNIWLAATSADIEIHFRHLLSRW